MKKYGQEILANLERANESLKAAQRLLAERFFDFAASRAYYSAFYAITAALLCEEEEFGKHSGAIAAFHKKFIKTGRLDKKYGRNLNWLFELRGIGDYGQTTHVPPEDAVQANLAAEAILKAIEKEIAG